MRRLIVLLYLLAFCAAETVLASPAPESAAAFHKTTDWELKPSLKYDALCLLNALSGDPYYLEYYRAEYEHFHPLFTAEENSAFEQLKHVIKYQGNDIISAKLALYYSVVDDETIPEMIRTAHDSSAMKIGLQKTEYWSDEGWKNYEEAQPALEAALKALHRVGFAGYWEQTAKPKIEKRIAELAPELPKYNIVPVIERILGFPLPSDRVTVYLLAYSEPHGIRISGLRFLTHVSYPFEIVLHNAIHESMHPPYDANEPAVREAIELLGHDPVIVDKVKNHDPSFGYNTAPGYIEEDSVQALEEIVSEKFGVGRNARDYWKEQDGGMHVLATAIYVEYKQELASTGQPYGKWFVAAVKYGDLRGTKLQSAIKGFSSGTSPSSQSSPEH